MMLLNIIIPTLYNVSSKVGFLPRVEDRLKRAGGHDPSASRGDAVQLTLPLGGLCHSGKKAHLIFFFF